MLELTIPILPAIICLSDCAYEYCIRTSSHNTVLLVILMTQASYACVCLLHENELSFLQDHLQLLVTHLWLPSHPVSLPTLLFGHHVCVTCLTVCAVHEFIFPPSNNVSCWCCSCCCWSCFYWSHHCLCCSCHCVSANCSIGRILLVRMKITLLLFFFVHCCCCCCFSQLLLTTLPIALQQT